MKTMKKILKSLPFQLLLGVIIGIVAGADSNEAVMNVIVTIKFVLGELINFCVPLIVIGFIAPSITKLGKNASRILGVAVLLAYVSSVLAALGSMAAGYGLIPHLSIVSEVDGLKELPEIVFQLEIPQIMSVMSALAFSILIGLAATWTKAETVIRLLDEFQQIVLMIVSKIVIPILPVFIALTFWSLAYEGNDHKAAAGISQGCADRDGGALYLDGGFICSGWNLLRKQSVESCKALWSGIHYCSGNDVLCCNACSGFKMCQKVGAGTEG